MKDRVKARVSRWRRNVWSCKKLGFWFFGFFAAVSSGWIAGCIEALLVSWISGEALKVAPGVLLIEISITLVSVLGLYRLRSVYSRPQTRSMDQQVNPPKKRHLVLFLSSIRVGGNINEDCTPKWLELTDKLDDDLEALAKAKGPNGAGYWSWEMPLRAIRHHRGVVSSVSVVGSRESIRQAPQFFDVIKRYGITDEEGVDIGLGVLARDRAEDRLIPAESFDVESGVEGYEFERFDSLCDALLGLFVLLQEQHGAKDRNIVVDLTGGQKVSSVVAAAVAFNRAIDIQYVQTGAPYDVLGYDLVLGSPEDPIS